MQHEERAAKFSFTVIVDGKRDLSGAEKGKKIGQGHGERHIVRLSCPAKMRVARSHSGHLGGMKFGLRSHEWPVGVNDFPAISGRPGGAEMYPNEAHRLLETTPPREKRISGVASPLQSLPVRCFQSKTAGILGNVPLHSIARAARRIRGTPR